MMCRYLALCFLVLLSWTGAIEQKSDSIVAIVNDETITYGEVYQKTQEGLRGIQSSNLSPLMKEQQKRKLFTIALRQIVEDKLILQEAKRYKINVSQEAINELVEKEIKERDIQNPEELNLADLIRNRLTLQELFQKKSGYSPAEKRRAAIDTFVRPMEIRAYYQNNLKSFTEEKKIKTRIITLYYSKNGGREEALTKAEAIVKEIRSGADFAELAKTYSNDYYAKEGGTWPRPKKDEKIVWDFFGKNELHEEVEDIAFTMEVGEVSDPIPVDSFCQIIKIEDIEQGGEISFSEVQEGIRQRLRYQKVIAALTRIREKLIQRSYIWPSNLFDQDKK